MWTDRILIVICEGRKVRIWKGGESRTKAGTGRNLEDSIVCAVGSGMDLSSENPGEIYRLLRYINDMRDQLSAEADSMHP